MIDASAKFVGEFVVKFEQVGIVVVVVPHN